MVNTCDVLYTGYLNKDIRDSKMGLQAQTTTFLPLLWCTNAVDEN